MFRVIKFFVYLTVVTTDSLANEEKGCFKQLFTLGKCCHFTIDKEIMMNSLTCGHHLSDQKGSDEYENSKSFACYFDCLYRDRGVIDTLGNFNLVKAKELIESFLISTPEFILTAGAAVAECISEVTLSDPLGLQHNGNNQCDFRPFMFNLCIYREILKNCPANNWTDSAECNGVKQNFHLGGECHKKH